MGVSLISVSSISEQYVENFQKKRPFLVGRLYVLHFQFLAFPVVFAFFSVGVHRKPNREINETNE